MGAGLSPRDGRLAGKADGETVGRLTVEVAAGDNLVAREGDDKMLRRGVRCEVATVETTGVIEGGVVATTIEEGTSCASLDISHVNSGDISLLKGIRVELGPGDVRAGGWTATWVTSGLGSGIIKVDDGTIEGGLVALSIYLEAPAA